MGWMEQLYRTYQRCRGLDQPPPPIAHAVQQAHLQITIDGAGQFLDARVLDKEETIIPATEDSANRTSKPTPHPLADKIIYCAGDYTAHGGEKASYFDLYLRQLRDWAASPHSHPKVRAVLAYVERGTLVADLIRVGVMPVGEDGRLAVEWPDPQTMPALLRQLPPKADGDRRIREVGDALVRWRVELPDADNADTWGDPGLTAAWIAYYAATQSRLGLCMVEGRELPLAEKHPGRLRNGADKAKLISSNDGSGFTYRGRFTDADQAAAIGFEVSQKAHNALRWLIERQGTPIGEQRVVAWTTGGNPSAGDLCDEFEDDRPYGAAFPDDDALDPVGDVGQNQSRQLGRAARGGAAEIDPSDDVMVMVLDAATPGRMSVRYYRELKGSEFLANIAAWRKSLRWRQAGGVELRDGKRVPRRFDGSPSLKSIAGAAHGPNADDKLIQATVMRLLPCIVEGRPPPEDLGRAAFHRACRRIGLRGEWEFEKVLGIACALYRANHQTEEYQMALEEDRITRDYLFGRLLAVGEYIEASALEITKEKRDTKAAQYMQHFANRPASTWKTMYTELGPYCSRLRANAPALQVRSQKLLDQVMAAFRAEDFTSDLPLGPEFLLGYHCQRHALYQSKAEAAENAA